MENIEREASKEIKAIPLSDGQTNVFVCKDGTHWGRYNNALQHAVELIQGGANG